MNQTDAAAARRMVQQLPASAAPWMCIGQLESTQNSVDLSIYSFTYSLEQNSTSQKIGGKEPLRSDPFSVKCRHANPKLRWTVYRRPSLSSPAIFVSTERRETLTELIQLQLRRFTPAGQCDVVRAPACFDQMKYANEQTSFPL